MGEMILLKLDKVPLSGLGLSLASKRDRDRMGVLVVAVKSTCPLSVKIGDELLEVHFCTSQRSQLKVTNDMKGNDYLLIQSNIVEFTGKWQGACRFATFECLDDNA